VRRNRNRKQAVSEQIMMLRGVRKTLRSIIFIDDKKYITYNYFLIKDLINSLSI
jgi:hypothetical protein